jgi:hypothetical protein
MGSIAALARFLILFFIPPLERIGANVDNYATVEGRAQDLSGTIHIMAGCATVVIS